MARIGMLLVCHIILAVFWPSALVQALPRLQTRQKPVANSSSYWVANINRQGTVAYGKNANYQIYRNVKDFGAKGTPDILVLGPTRLTSTRRRCE